MRPLIGIVFGGERGLYWRLTGRQNLEYWGALYKLSEAEAVCNRVTLIDRGRIVGGMIVTGDRWEGLLEPVLATPSELAPLIPLKPAPIDNFWGRLAMIVLLGALSFAVGRGVLAYVLHRMRST